MARLLQILTFVFGVVCGLISLAHIALGPGAIPGEIPEAVLANATIDSQDRFYATLFLGFGAALIWCAQDLDARRGAFFALLVIFFLGGLARLLSVAMIGWPLPLFIVLGLIELILPPVFWWVHGRSFDRWRA